MTALGPTIDLRSDTVTQPTAAMREAMAAAPLGDDVYGSDPSVNELQEKIAARLGFEAALFMPTGTQSNLCAILAHCARGDEYIVGQQAHCYRWEGGGAAVFGRVVERLGLHAAQHRRAAALPAVAVRLLADDVLVAAPAVREHGAQVALGAGGHEQRRLEAQQRGDPLLQRVDARVGAEDVVAQWRGGHGLAHRRSRLRDGVAAQVDGGAQGVHRRCSFSRGNSSAWRGRAR
jgi:hypothetical protein